MADYENLTLELEKWRTERKTATFWWRDDDLTEPTESLHRLLSLRQYFDIPLSVAVIPESAHPSLLDYLGDCSILQHGYRHVDLSQEGEKKSEYPASRNLEEAVQEIGHGREILSDIFKDQFYPVFVPPWNRISGEAVSALSKLGYIALSRYQPRKQIFASRGLIEINTHVDVINWRGDRSVVKEPFLLDMVLNHLRARRKNRILRDEPTGLLTHHLVHDEDTWATLFQLMTFLTEHHSVRWIPLRTAVALNNHID